MKNLKLVETASEAVKNKYLTVYGIKNENKVIIKGAKIVPEGYVDLGLPSGKLWAKCNVGATSETEYGKYFQWGDVEGRTADEISSKPCNWSTAPFNNGSSSYDSSYFASVKDDVCPNGVLATDYDAVYQATNGQAHMPTDADFKELTANTTVTWYESGNTEFNGVAGHKFTSKVDSTKYIFIPSAGFAGNGSLYYQGSNGYVWSSSLYSSNPGGAWYLYFNSGNMYVVSSNRCNGYSVRGVLE